MQAYSKCSETEKINSAIFCSRLNYESSSKRDSICESRLTRAALNVFAFSFFGRQQNCPGGFKLSKPVAFVITIVTSRQPCVAPGYVCSTA